MAAEDLSVQPPNADPEVANPVEDAFFRFPPFPAAPEGVKILAFKDFKERGIRIDPGPDDAEVDGLGIPTTMLKVSHSADKCKTNTKRKRHAEETTRKAAGMAATKRDWWQVWEETEMIRFSKGFNPISSRFERVQASTVDFTRDHAWPAQTKKETGPKFVWEKFLRYVGVPEGFAPIVEQTQSKKTKREAQDALEEGDLSDDEVDGDDEDHGTDGIIIDGAPVPAGVKKKVTTNEDRLMAFLDDPDKSIRIFMTSYAYGKGLMWSEENLQAIPRILKFFVDYLLRSNVLPETERPLRRSLEAISAAVIELPNTSPLMSTLPDKFGSGCTGCWGKKAEGYSAVIVDIPEVKPEAIPEEVAEEEPESKKQKFEEETPTGPANSTSEWGGGDGNGWASGEASGWGDFATENVNVFWGGKDEQPHVQIFGPTAFPLTHTTGVVERSMRRVKSILPPAPNPPKSPPSVELGPDATAVEVELDRYFSKIIFSPLVNNWDGGEAPVYSCPTILKSSKGPIVGQESTSETPSEGGPKPHDPLNDDIIVLIESTHAGFLCEGMGIGGTWVQLVRQGPPKKKKKGKSKKPPSYWYLEEAAFAMPSFWTPGI